MSDNTVITCICVLVVGLILFMLFGCKMTCSKAENYRPGGLASNCYGLNRSGVDFAFKGPEGHQQNPHYQTNPASRFQPLEQGPIDFYFDERRLEDGPLGEVFDGFNPDYAGSGRDLHHIQNDEHNRFNLTNIGSLGKRNYMDDIYNKAFGPKGYQYNEQRRVRINPYFDRMYGGMNFLTHDRIGN